MELNKIKNYLYLLFVSILSSWSLYEDEKLVTLLLLSFFTFLSYVLAINISEKLFKILIIFTALIVSIVYPIKLSYGPIDLNIISSFMYSNKNEMFSYIKISHFSVILKSIIIVSFILISLFIKYYKLKFKVIFILILFFIFPLCKLIIYGINMNAIINSNYFSYTRIILKSINYTRSVLGDDKNIRIIEDSVNLNTYKECFLESKKDFYVMILGESARSDLMNSYGFQIKNTPFMSISNGIQFDNVISVSPSTNYSTRRIFFENTNTSNINYSNNIITLVKKIGFKTVWITNQNENLKVKNPINTLEKLADKYYPTGDHIGSDFNVLPLLKKAVYKQEKSPQLIIVHLYGSHPSSCDRTNGNYTEFLLSKDVSCYIESIRNTDLLLEKIIQTLDSTGKKYNAIYISDHGVALNNYNNFTHSDKYKGAFNIPLFVWGDDIKDRIHIKSKRNNKDFLILLKELIGFNSNKIFLSEKMMKNTDEVINMKQEKIFYSDLIDDNILQ